MSVDLRTTVSITYLQSQSGSFIVHIISLTITTISQCVWQTRTNIIRKAFNKIDKNKSGDLTVDDLKGVYNVSQVRLVVAVMSDSNSHIQTSWQTILTTNSAEILSIPAPLPL